MLKVPKIRSEKHRRWIASLGCVICDKRDVQAAHIRIGNNAGMGLKSCDSCTLPLCVWCHMDQHTIGERLFWEPYGGIETATKLAKKLFGITENDVEAMELIRSFKNDSRSSNG